MKQTRIEGLYAITPDMTDTGELVSRAQKALRGGATLLQYRNKLADSALRRMQARALLELCRDHGVPFIINDHVQLCAELDADGVHLGRNDGDIAAARHLLGTHKLIGASCHDCLDLARHAQAQGADYVAFGACFGSTTKPAAVHAPLELFKQARPLGLPMVAIGGITTENAHLAIEAGASAIAVIGGLWDSEDIERTASRFSCLFDRNHHDFP
jgi:thiamine-phosphate pyrophosphorylase